MSRKRANGEGTYRKKGNSYEYRTCFEMPSGEIIRKSFSAKTKRECLEKADKFKNNINNTIVLEKSTLEHWAVKWLETYKKSTVTADTYISYKYDQKIILEDKIAKMDLSKIKPIHIQAFFNRISNYAMSRQKKIRSMLIAIFNKGIENNLCLTNPALNAKLTNSNVRKREAYTEKEVKTITEFAQTHDFGLAIMLLLYSGVRRGELLALTWNCYDKENGILTVNSTLTQTDGIKIGDTSTKKHNREIPLPKQLCDMLDKTKRTGLYIISKDSSYMTISQFRSSYDKFFKDLKEWCLENNLKIVRKLPTHSLRHTYGTMLYRKNINLKTIQVLMGHSSIDVTANIYTHTDIDTSKKAVLLAFEN